MSSREKDDTAVEARIRSVIDNWYGDMMWGDRSNDMTWVDKMVGELSAAVVVKPATTQEPEGENTPGETEEPTRAQVTELLYDGLLKDYERVVDAYDAGRVVTSELNTEIDRLRERLQIDPGGGDAIDAAESALTHVITVRDEYKAENERLRKKLQAIHDYARCASVRIGNRNWLEVSKMSRGPDPAFPGPACPECNGSGIEFVYVGHGNIRELPCSVCQRDGELSQ